MTSFPKKLILKLQTQGKRKKRRFHSKPVEGNPFCSDLVVECHFHYLSYIHPQAQNSPNLALRFHHLVFHMRATSMTTRHGGLVCC